jgi:L-threonylcarbamoyladenylate synthase
VTTELEVAVTAVRDGKAIIFPTDTVYGIGARPDDPAATGAVFEAKERPRDLALPVLAASVDDAARIAAFDARATRLAEAFWPGTLTIVLPRSERSRMWDLGGDGMSIGVRVPGHPLTLELLRRTGPLAVTSANRSGEAPGEDRDALVAIFGDRVGAYLGDPFPLRGTASTVIDLTGPEALILRRGDLDPETVLALAR